MRRASLLVLLLPFAYAPVSAAEPDWQLCPAAISGAEHRLRLPPGLLPAIARVESGRQDARTGRVLPWPWTIDAEGVGQFLATKAEAIAAVRGLQARGVRSIDVGCLQVNLLHHPDAFASLDAAFDPATNASYGGRFLAALHARSASWPVAAASYHSQTPDLADAYRRRVLAAWGQADPLPSPPAPPVPERVAYRDFVPAPRTAYAAFAPSERAYGAFAPAPPAR